MTMKLQSILIITLSNLTWYCIQQHLRLPLCYLIIEASMKEIFHEGFSLDKFMASSFILHLLTVLGPLVYDITWLCEITYWCATKYRWSVQKCECKGVWIQYEFEFAVPVCFEMMWWQRHTFHLLAICEGNPPVTGNTFDSTVRGIHPWLVDPPHRESSNVDLWFFF